MASSLKRLRVLFIVFLMATSVRLVKPKQLVNLNQRDLKDNLKSLFDLLNDDFSDNTDDNDDDDNGYARDDDDDYNRNNKDPNEYGSNDDRDISRLETVPPSSGYNNDDDDDDTDDSYDYRYNNDNKDPNEYGTDDDRDISRLETVPPSSGYNNDDDDDDTDDSYDYRYYNDNKDRNEYGTDDDRDISRLETVPPSSGYNNDDDDDDTDDSYDYRYNNDNRDSYEYGSSGDGEISRLETVPPSTTYNMISDMATSPTDRTVERKYFLNNNTERIEQQEGSERGKEREGQVLVPEQLQQQERQEQEPNQKEYQRTGLENEEQSQQEQQPQQQPQQQQQNQTGKQQQQQQTSLNSSVIANYNDTYQDSSAFISNQSQGLSNISVSAPSNTSSNGSVSNEQTNLLCSTELNLYDLCNLSLDPEGISYANPFTFRSLENIISHNTTRQSLKNCQPGHWCLGPNVKEGKLENFPRHFCRPPLQTCLEVVVEELQACSTYQKYTTILSSLNMVCEYFRQDPELKYEPQCGVRLMEMISVTFSDMEREIPVQESDQCNSRTSLMQSSFRCLMNGCNVLENNIFTRFPPWQWFITSLDSHKQCPLNCSGGTLDEVNVQITESPTTDRSLMDVLLTRSTIVTTPRNERDVEGAAELQYNAVHKPGQTGSSIHVLNSWNIGLIATSVAVLLIILFSIIAVIIWRRLKDTNIPQNQGYSKLKTGEC